MKEGFATTSRQILADQVHMGPNSNLNQWLCSSTEPSWGYTLTRELGGGTGLPDSDPQTRCLPAPHPSLLILRQDTESQPHPLGRVPSALSDKKSRDNSWKLCGPVALELREEQTEPVVCRAIGLIWPRNVSLGLLELRQQRALLVLQLLLQLHTGRKSNAWPCSWLNIAFSYLTRKPNQSTQETT